ncbi:MAG: ABC transporter permease, partial [Oscillospiraceae bacterium]|nr:ABC transporter permease [Oscillospiraceae bacterium]
AVVESKTFGLLFVTPETYNTVISSKNKGVKAEEYVYAFHLGSRDSYTELRETIEDFEFNYRDVQNAYFQDTINNALTEKYDIQNSVDELTDGAKVLRDGMDELDGNSNAMLDAVDELFNSYLKATEQSLNTQGVFLGLTKENYAEKLENLISDIQNGKMAEVDNPEDSISQLKEMKESLDSLIEFSDGVYQYTDGMQEAAKGADELFDGTKEMQDGIDELLDKAFEVKLNNLTSFVKADSNVRIGAAASDVEINRIAGLFAGIIILILFTYVISVFVINQIEQESGIIGAMYALGIEQHTLMKHYVTLPVLVTCIGGIIGTILGFSPIGIPTQMADTYAYYSVQNFDVYYAPYLIAYGILLPPLICMIVNTLAINKKLSKTALSLMRNEQKASDIKQFNIKTKNFTRRFQIRQLSREIRSVLTVVCGMLLSVILIELGLDIYVMCDAVKVYNVRDTKFSYQYLYKYPTEKVPNGGEGAYIETLSIDNNGYMLDVTIIGLNENSKYFNAVLPKGKNKAAISNSIYERYHLHDGDTFTLIDNVKDMNYHFTVEGLVEYSPGFTIFMDIDSMRELFNQSDDYFNTVYSDKELDIEEGRLYSILTKKDVENVATIYVNLMMGMIIMVILVSVIVFCVVVYLMMNVMIDKSKFGISLIKIFGFRSGEVRKMYLDGNFLVVAVGGLFCIPIGKVFIDSVYPNLITNIASCMKLEYPWYLYLAIYAGILIVYLIINSFLMRKIDKITPAEVLKERE